MANGLSVYDNLILASEMIVHCGKSLQRLRTEPTFDEIRELLILYVHAHEFGFKAGEDPFCGDRPIDFHGIVTTSVHCAIIQLAEMLLRECFKAAKNDEWCYADWVMDHPGWMSRNEELLERLSAQKIAELVHRVDVPEVDLSSWCGAEFSTLRSKKRLALLMQKDWDTVEDSRDDGSDLEMPLGMRKLCDFMLRSKNGTFESLRDLDVWNVDHPTDSAIEGRLKQLRQKLVKQGYWFTISDDFTWKWTKRPEE